MISAYNEREVLAGLIEDLEKQLPNKEILKFYLLTQCLQIRQPILFSDLSEI